MATRHETELYRLESDRFGFYTLIRKWDGATGFFQGDDALLWSRNMDSIEAIDFGDGSVNSLDRSFNFLCSGYDDILSTHANRRDDISAAVQTLIIKTRDTYGPSMG